MHDIDLIISGGKALLLDEANTCLDNAGIAIHDSSIIDIGRREDILKRYAAKKIIDAEGSLVLPGFVNTHTHAAMTCFRGIADDLELMDWLNNYIFPAEAKNVNPHLAYWGSMLACAEMIKSGTTTFCDMYIFEEETARAAKEAGSAAWWVKFSRLPRPVAKRSRKASPARGGLLKSGTMTPGQNHRRTAFALHLFAPACSRPK